jgi:hypothetical protein
MQALNKLFEHIINCRLSAITAAIINPAQAAYTKRKSTMYRIQMLFLFNEEQNLLNNSAYFFFVDFSKAFDTLPVRNIIQFLCTYKFCKSSIELITNLTTENKTWFQFGNVHMSKFLDPVEIRNGIC